MERFWSGSGKSQGISFLLMRGNPVLPSSAFSHMIQHISDNITWILCKITIGTYQWQM